MLAERKRPHPLTMETPPHIPSSPAPKTATKPLAREFRDANVPASPQPQQNSGHHHPQHSYHQSSHHPHTSQQQAQKVPATRSRRDSTDRGTKDSIKTRSTTPKAAPEHVGPYLLGRTLGKGSSGCVKLARHRKTGEQVAVKIISKASLANKAAVNRGIEREIAIMKLINHPHVIRLYDVYETEKELFLVMEYVSGGELFEYLVNKGRLEEAEALRFFQQIIVGLAFCHKRKICHRDLKPENLLLDDRMNVKIADFGMASLQKTGRLLETSCGSPHYASPEVVTGLKYDGSSSDIWSCGIILYALLTGHLPFDDENIRQLLSKVKAGKFHMPTDISPGARDLISRMLTVNPKRRITMQGVMMHPWFRMVNPDRNTLGEPAEDPESSRLLLPEELDAEIIVHMRWLFAPGPSHSDPEAKEVFDEEALLREIEDKVTNDEENMEKLFYHLLCQHKTELLENYSGDDNGSVPDAPRRRADSFPSSAVSVRSHTPDFIRASRSPRDSPLTSPGSPLSPMIKTSPIEPSPLTLNPLEAAVARAASAAKIAARSPSPTLKTLEASTITKPRQGEALGEVKVGSLASDALSTSRGSSKEQGRRHSVNPTPAVEIATPTLKAESNKEGVVQGEAPEPISGAEKMTSAEVPAPCHPLVIAPKPISPIVQRSSVVYKNNSLASAAASAAHTVMEFERGQHDTAKTMESQSMTDNDQGASATTSIESQVLSTQIADAVSPPLLDRRAVSETEARAGASPGMGSSVDATFKKSTASKKMQRPILHLLDVKASAGITTMSVCVSQHSRKSSDGTTSVQPVTSMSPSGPKRPWFARLFDFKPQPLTFRSNWSAAETQERLEGILKNLFQNSIQTECYKKPSYGIKCRYEGGVINEQPAKAVKFKVEVNEKAGFLASGTSGMSNNSSASNTSSHVSSSSAVATILATVDHHHHGNHSQSHLPPGGVPATVMSQEGIVGRRASDGGSILSSAAAAMSTSLAAARDPFLHHHHLQHSSGAGVHHHPPHHHPSAAASSPVGQGAGAYPPLPHPSTLPRRTVKVTLHQQQGANSTLKIIYERLQAVWDQQMQIFEQQALSCNSGSPEFSMIASPLPMAHKAQRGAAI